MEGYSWRIKGLNKGVEAAAVAEELDRIKNLNGTLTPTLIVEAATPKRSVLHPLFEWDDEVASYHWRIQQARIILNNIQVVVISDGETRNLDVYEVVCSGEGYKSIATFDADDVEFVRKTTRSQLVSIQVKLKTYNQFEKVRELIKEAIEAMA